MRDVAKSFGRRPAVGRASLRVRAGTALGLNGPSGLGKSTLLEIMAGLTKPDAGRLERAVPASLMFQDGALVPWLSALENVAYVLPGDRRQAARTAAGWLERFELTPDLRPAALSGGMRRRLGLARALCPGRELLLLDEPFAFLDQRWVEAIAQLILEEVQKGTGVVVAGHSTPPALAQALGRRLTVVEAAGPPLTVEAWASGEELEATMAEACGAAETIERRTSDETKQDTPRPLINNS
jgi:NitT/TauT family transport system ATP-binding protein